MLAWRSRSYLWAAAGLAASAGAAHADIIAARQFTLSAEGFASGGVYRIYLALGDRGLHSGPPPASTIMISTNNLGGGTGRVGFTDAGGGGFFFLREFLTNGTAQNYNLGLDVGAGGTNTSIGEPALFGSPSPWPVDLQGAQLDSITVSINAVTITPINLGGESAHRVDVTFTIEFNGVPAPGAAALLILPGAAAARRRRAAPPV